MVYNNSIQPLYHYPCMFFCARGVEFWLKFHPFTFAPATTAGMLLFCHVPMGSRITEEWRRQLSNFEMNCKVKRLKSPISDRSFHFTVLKIVMMRYVSWYFIHFICQGSSYLGKHATPYLDTLEKLVAQKLWPVVQCKVQSLRLWISDFSLFHLSPWRFVSLLASLVAYDVLLLASMNGIWIMPQSSTSTGIRKTGVSTNENSPALTSTVASKRVCGSLGLSSSVEWSLCPVTGSRSWSLHLCLCTPKD